MNETKPLAVSSPAADERRRLRTKAIEDFVTQFAPGVNADLLSEMMTTICRLSVDGTDRGDLKILNTALKELRYAFKVFAPYREVPKVSMFGSARTPTDHPQYLQAVRFGELIQKEGWMVITGAGDGIMRAGHHGATQASSFGVAISLPFEQATNTIIADDPKLVMFKYFFTRKLIFVREATAIALFPGGFGTQDEGFESITLVQTVKTEPKPIVMVNEPGGSYWQHWRRYVEDELLRNRMIDVTDLNLFYITDKAEDAVAHIMQFYRRYHSCRYVDNRLVLRLNSPVGSQTLAEIRDAFADMIKDGTIEQQHGPLQGERGVYPDKTRLLMSFDRRSAGRLRMLIDRLNRDESAS
ncbi:MAG: LOG family protein [Planctomycetota bacterium]